MKRPDNLTAWLAGAVLLLSLLYIAVAMDVFRGPNWLDTSSAGRYFLLGKAFLHGRTWLEEAATGQIGNWDLSPYQGHYYMYFGAVPALVLYLPVYLVTFGGVEVTDKAAVLIFSIGLLAVCAAILHDLRRRFFPAASSWLAVAALAIVAVCGGSTVLLSHVRVYEVAIAAGLFFLLAAVYFALEPLTTPAGDSRPRRLAVISALLILAVGCRPTLFIVAAGLIALLAWRLLQAGSFKTAPFASLVAPFAVGLALLAAYNVARFGSPFEFGWHYQLTTMDQGRLSILDPARLVTGLDFNLFQFPRRIDQFPWLLVQNGGFQGLPDPYYLEYPLGLFAAAPFVVFALAALPLAFVNDAHLRLAGGARKGYLLLMSLGAASLLYLSAAPAVVDRYRCEFAVFFLLAAALGWLHLDQALSRQGRPLLRGALAAVALLLGAAGCYINLFVCTWFT